MRRIGLAVVLTLGVFAPLVASTGSRLSRGSRVLRRPKLFGRRWAARRSQRARTRGGHAVFSMCAMGTGDLKSVEAAARSLEGEKVDLIVAVTTTVTLAAKRVTRA